MPDGLMDPGQIGAGILNAFQMGQQQRQQAETQNALAAYAQNQTPQNAANVIRFNPVLGLQLQDREAQRQQQLKAQQDAETQKQITAAALQGDPQARQALAYYNSDLYMKLDDQHKKLVDQTMGAIAQQAYAILQMPKEQQEPALQQALAGLQAQGLDVSQFHLSGNPEADLKAALAMTGHLDDYEKFAQPHYQMIPAGGTLVNTGNPQAIQQFQQSQGGPQPGTVEDGYRFKGGNPADPNSWEPAGGSGGNAAGNFPSAIERYYNQH